MRKRKIRGGVNIILLYVLIFSFLYLTSLNVSALGPGMFNQEKMVHIEDNWIGSDISIVTNSEKIIRLARELKLETTADFFLQTRIYFEKGRLTRPLTELQAEAANELMKVLRKELTDKPSRMRLEGYSDLLLLAPSA